VNPEDAEEYTQALGQVVAGGWRQIALGERLGVPKALNMTTRAWVEERLGGYVKFSIGEERKEAVKSLVDDGYSERQIPEILGIDRETVRKDLGKPRDGRKPTTIAQDQEDKTGDCGWKPTAAAATLPTKEELETVLDAAQRLDDLRATHREYPERIAADEIYESLQAELDHLRTWVPRLTPEHPGRLGPDDWQMLLKQWRDLTMTITQWSLDSFKEVNA
jgi:hypothetical protein